MNQSITFLFVLGMSTLLFTFLFLQFFAPTTTADVPQQSHTGISNVGTVGAVVQGNSGQVLLQVRNENG
ncbi:hypothetical protein HYS48_02150 [Candidatus Woesearchaeota archaeon]|nr:hypothetical protein [Candidatus Woesearchaeota archaeon]